MTPTLVPKLGQALPSGCGLRPLQGILRILEGATWGPSKGQGALWGMPGARKQETP